jgi:sulfoxide reductase catalytic subunit YedY
MARRWTNDLTRDDVTPYRGWLNRRQILAGLGAGASGLALSGFTGPAEAAEGLEPNTWDEITSYNNFYEFGTDKGDPKRYAGRMTTAPWSIEIDGLVERPGTYDLQDILAEMTQEERIYRLRCVEAWSMVIPWTGFEFNDLLDMAGVAPEARYVAFETLLRPSEMPGTRFRIIDWPYVEGLRLDEARHPLTIMATGIYDRPMANQNGAPIRLVVPWKYGFKSIKSVVRITLTEDEPPTSWNKMLPNEYGFYSNVNPTVDHPRWSQASERRIGGGLFSEKIPTLMFNGYEAEVAHLYEGMDLTRFY